MVRITEGSTIVTITDNGAGDSDPTVGQISYTAPAATFADFDVSGLTATSNSGGVTLANLTMGGTVARTTTTGGDLSLLLEATDTGFSVPSLPPNAISSSAGVTFTNAANGNTSVFQSFGDDANAAFSHSTPTPPIPLTATGAPTESLSGNAPSTNFGASAPFSLTNQTFVTLSQNSGATVRQAGISGSTTVTVPEPASIALVSIGALGGLVVLRRRKATV